MAKPKKNQRPGKNARIARRNKEAEQRRAAEAGGTVFQDPLDIPGVGRFAVIADPGGALFSIFQPAGGAPMAQASFTAASHVGWHDLRAGDGEAAWEFYSKLFGWVTTETMEAMPGVPYRMFVTGSEQAAALFDGATLAFILVPLAIATAVTVLIFETAAVVVATRATSTSRAPEMANMTQESSWRKPPRVRRGAWLISFAPSQFARATACGSADGTPCVGPGKGRRRASPAVVRRWRPDWL